MTTEHDPQDIFLQPPRAYYCGFCDSEVATFCGVNVLRCQEERAALRRAAPCGIEAPPNRAACGVVNGIGLSILLWAMLALAARLVGLL